MGRAHHHGSLPKVAVRGQKVVPGSAGNYYVELQHTDRDGFTTPFIAQGRIEDVANQREKDLLSSLIGDGKALVWVEAPLKKSANYNSYGGTVGICLTVNQDARSIELGAKTITDMTVSLAEEVLEEAKTRI